jgi:hypothetical protein
MLAELKAVTTPAVEVKPAPVIPIDTDSGEA